MRHRIRWPLAALTMVALLAACGQAPVAPQATNEPQATAQPAAQATEAAPTQAAPANTVELSLAISPANPKAGAPPNDWDAFKLLRERHNINLKVSLIPNGPDGETKLNADAAADNLPDLFQLTNRNMFYTFADQGLIAPVDDILPLMPSSAKQRFSDPTLNQLAILDGKIYGFQKKIDIYKRSALFVRQDWLDKLGLKAPKTLDDFLAVAKAFTTQDPDGNGQNDTYGFGSYIGTNNGLGGQFDFIYGAYGVAGNWNLKDATSFGSTLREPGFRQATDYIHQLVEAKVIDPDWPTLKYDDFRARAKQGKYGLFIMDSCAIMCELNWRDFEASNPTGKLAIIDSPTGPDGKSTLGTFSAAGPLYVVSQRAIDAGKGPAIAQLWEWIDTEGGYDQFIFGTEGVNFKRAADGAITTEGLPKDAAYTSEARLPHTQLKFMAARGNEAELRARYPSFTTAAGERIEPLQLFKTAFDQPYIDQTALLLTKPASNQADINRYISENLVQFALGQKSIDDTNWQGFIQGLDGVNFGAYEAAIKQTLQTSGALK